MCESTVYFETPAGREKVMEEVARIEIADSSITMASILGQQKRVRGRVISIDFLGHSLVIRPL